MKPRNGSWTSGSLGCVTLAQTLMVKSATQDPVRGVGDTLKEKTYDEVIISTLPSGLSRWLHQDLPHRVERKYKLPVTVVTAKSVPASRVPPRAPLS